MKKSRKSIALAREGFQTRLSLGS